MQSAYFKTSIEMQKLTMVPYIYISIFVLFGYKK